MGLTVHLFLRLVVPNPHLNPLEIADIAELHLTGLRRVAEPTAYIYIVLRTSEPLLQVPEVIGITVVGPRIQGIVGIGQFLAGIVDAADFTLCQITALRQVLIAFYQRVYILIHLMGQQHRGNTPAFTIIIVVHQPVGFPIAVVCRTHPQE